MKARVFNIMQYEYHPIDAYDENGDLLVNAVPLITEQQIIDGLNHRTIKQWAYIRHDADVYSEKDEADDTTGKKRAGDPKPPHWHIVLNCPTQVEVSAVAKWFGVPENFIDVPKLDKTIESVEKLKEDLYECYIKPDRDDDKWQ